MSKEAITTQVETEASPFMSFARESFSPDPPVEDGEQKEGEIDLSKKDATEKRKLDLKGEDDDDSKSISSLSDIMREISGESDGEGVETDGDAGDRSDKRYKSDLTTEQEEQLSLIIGGIDKPKSDAPASDHFEYLKRCRDALYKKLEETKSEGVDKEAVNKAEVLESRVKELEQSNSELSKKLYSFDVEQDPEFISKYVKPIKDQEADVIEEIRFLPTSDEIRNEVVKIATEALNTSDVSIFRQQLNKLSETIDGPSAVRLHNGLVELFRLHTKKSEAMKDADSLSRDLGQNREANRKSAASEFVQKDLAKIEQGLNEKASIMDKIAENPAFASVNGSKEVVAIENFVKEAIEDQFLTHGGVTKKMGALAAMAKTSIRDRIITSEAIKALNDMNAKYTSLMTAYKKITGEEFKASAASSSKSDATDSGSLTDEQVKEAGGSSLAALARQQGLF